MTSAHIAAVTAFSLWGLFPLYWKLFSGVPAWDLFGHRLIWSFITLLLILVFKKNLSSVRNIWRDKTVRFYLMLSSLLISSNWLLYIYAVSTGKVLEASMGYFLNPLINIFVGWLILKEELRRSQWPAILLALASIILMAVQADLAHFPWIAIVLSLTFALYGIIRNKTHVGSIEGLTFETCFIIGPVLLYWTFLPTGPLVVLEGLPPWKLLVLSLSGLVTCLPLVLFAFSARRLRLQTLGFIQYLSPSLKFVCGYLVLGEPLARDKLYAFFLIWTALAWYTTESFLFLRKQRRTLPS